MSPQLRLMRRGRRVREERETLLAEQKGLALSAYFGVRAPCVTAFDIPDERRAQTHALRRRSCVRNKNKEHMELKINCWNFAL